MISSPHPSGGATGRPASFALFTLLLSAMLLLPAAAMAYAPVKASKLGETPTSGGMRPGPLGLNPAPFRKLGVQPVAIKIAKASVDSQVENQEIVNGVMQNPSGPYIVSWYKETGKLGEDDNIVMAGHLDYWDVGQAVFFNLGKLKKGDLVEVTGADKTVHTYKVEWVRNYKTADLDQKGVQKIVGKTAKEELTLITCGGPFDYQKGEYLERMVVRAQPA